MSPTDGTQGHISKQSASYRHGLVLGLTMAEVMILLVFCLLIALAAFLQKEHDKRVEAERQRDHAITELRIKTAQANRSSEEPIKKDPGLSEFLGSLPSPGDPKLDEFWRELKEGQSIVTAAKQNGLTTAEVQSRMTDIKTLKEKGLDARKVERNALITATVDKAIPAATPDKVTQIIERGLIEKTPAKTATEGHKWPPIIALNDANGRFFQSGSAEVDPDFRKVLVEKTVPRIGELLAEFKEYGIDVIEVVGHTDGRPVGKKQSNLDQELVPALNDASSIAKVTASDNAGLGLARAVSVVSILRESKALDGYKILPLSGGQLINTNETLALGGDPGDVRERRRIEIRLRKATPRDTVPQQQQHPQQRPAVQTRADPIPAMPTPPPKPAALLENEPAESGPMQIIPTQSLLPSWLFPQPVR